MGWQACGVASMWAEADIWSVFEKDRPASFWLLTAYLPIYRKRASPPVGSFYPVVEGPKVCLRPVIEGQPEKAVVIRFDPSGCIMLASWPLYPVLAHSCISFCP